MRKVRYILLSLLIFVAFKPLCSQSSRLLKQAEKRYTSNNFAGAVVSWKKAFDQSSASETRQQLSYKIGEAYVQMNQLSDAITWLSDACSGGDAPVDWLILKAAVHLRLNQTNIAEKTVNQALEKQPYSRQLEDMLEMIQRWKMQQTKPDFPFRTLDAVNSPWSDYAAIWDDGRLLISSSRPANSRDRFDGRTAEYFSSIFESRVNSFGDFEPLRPVNMGRNLNVGTISFDPAHHRVFFTKCKNNIRRCALMVADYDVSSDKIGKAKRASFSAKNLHYGHPFVREDGKFLYFVSDMEGGYGGKDIYRISLRDDGGFGLAINMGPQVNSTEDELFPTAIGDSLLLFSVDRYTGFGGLDIYASRLFDENALHPVHLSYPFNSQADDFYLNLREGSVEGLLSSNRTGENNDEIYYFDAYPIRILLEGEVRDETTNKLLAATEIAVVAGDYEEINLLADSMAFYRLTVPLVNKITVTAEKSGYFPERRVHTVADTTQLIRQDFSLALLTFPAAISGFVRDRESQLPMPEEKVIINGPAGFSLETFTNTLGEYRFDSLKPNNIYTVRVSKEGYFNESRVCRIPEARKPLLLNKQNGVDMDFELTAIQEKKEVVINNIYYDFDKASLRESSKVELNKLVAMLRETPQVIVQINAHTDTRGSHNYNDKLSKERAASVVNYLILHGINPARLVSRGFGKTNPIIPNAKTEAEHQANRRTTFTVTGTNFQPVISEVPVVSKTDKLVYRVQLMASSSYYPPENYFAVLKTVIPGIRFSVNQSGSLYRYEAGDSYRLTEAESLKSQIIAAGFTDCFIVPYYAGERISMEQAKTWER